MNTYYQMHRSEQAALPSLVKNKETRLKMNGIVRRKKVSFFFVVVNVFLLLCCNSCSFDTNFWIKEYQKMRFFNPISSAGALEVPTVFRESLFGKNS